MVSRVITHPTNKKKMTSYYNNYPQIDWLMEPWGGPYDDEEEEDEDEVERLFKNLILLPIYGPLTISGAPLGHMFVSQ
jgi:hypothetical protein